MAGEISLKIKADASQAVKELAGVEKAGSSAGRTIEGVGRAKGKQGAEGVGLVNRELERLVKNTDSANKKVRELEANLKRVGQQKSALMGFVEAGAASPAQLKELEALRRYGSTQSRSLGHWQQVATDRQEAADRAGGNQPESPGRRSMWSRVTGAVSDMAGGGIRSALPEGAMGDMAGGLISKFGGPLAMLGVGAAAAKFVSMAYDAAAKEQKAYADFIPREGLGAKGYKGDPAAYMGHLRDMGRPLGYSGFESLQIASAMSTGGSTGQNLKADTKTAMQFARVMGMDAGESSTLLSSGQRLGGFKAGDARRFAEMLGREIGVNGLGRMAETGEATLSLMNQEMQSAGQSNPAMIMALQSVLNKTGVPGVQGAFGGNLLSRMNQAVTNPAGAAQEALSFRVYRELGVKTYAGMLAAREKGIAYPGFLGRAIRDIEDHSSPDMTRVLLNSYLNVPVSTSADLQRKSPGHRISNLFRGKTFDQMVKMLGVPGLLDKETPEAMKRPGNQLRRMEATGADFLARAGTPIVKGAGNLADRASRAYDNIERIATADEGLGAKADRLYEFLTGAKPGSVHAVDKIDHAVARFQHSPWAKSVLGASAAEHLTGAMPLEGFTYNPRTRRYDPKPRNAPPTLPPVPGSGAPQMPGGGRVRGYREDYRNGHTIRIIIEEQGVVSHASHQALRRTIHDCMDERGHVHHMVNPKSNYKGHS